MLQWYQRLMPRQGAFFALFQRHAAVTIAAARSLREMLSGGDQLKLRCEEILASSTRPTASRGRFLSACAPPSSRPSTALISRA